MGEHCILGNLGNNGCHCYYFFPISKKKDFFYVLHLINFKCVIGVPAVMAPIFVSSSNLAELSPVKSHYVIRNFKYTYISGCYR